MPTSFFSFGIYNINIVNKSPDHLPCRVHLSDYFHMVRHLGKNTTWMKWFSGMFITRGMLWWVVPLLVTLSSITWLRWGHNSFRMITLILLPTAKLLSEVQHLFIGPPYPLGPHMWVVYLRNPLGQVASVTEPSAFRDLTNRSVSGHAMKETTMSQGKLYQRIVKK